MIRMLRVGDRVVFDEVEHLVAAVTGSWVRLVAPDGVPSAVLLAHLVDSPGFAIVGHDDTTDARPGGLVAQGLEDLSQEAADRAREWERHVIEVETGLPPGSPPDATPRPEYDPAVHDLGERDAAKARELTATGKRTSVRTIQRMRQRYRAEGLRGLVDSRSSRTASIDGRADVRVVEAIREALAEETSRSTGTRDRLRRRVEEIVAGRHGDGVVSMPSRATFYRLVGRLSQGQHTFGPATTRRSLANRPEGAFTATWAARPGEQVQIDTTTLDVMAAFDDGHARRVELTAAIDVATRTICAAVLRPTGTKAVDASLLLARMLVPEPMRPGWVESLRMSASRLPHRQLADIDERMEQAAAKPVVVPETIVCDRGRVYLSETFLRACESLGISVQPAHPRTPTDKGIIERTFGSLNTLFCQHVAGYTGRDVAHRGQAVEAEAVWSMEQLQDLLDEWIIVGWQQRPHEGLRSPDTNRVLSPNEMYAVLVSAAGYLPVMLTGEDYIELLPSTWRTINDYGIRIDRRTYDTAALNPYRRQHSGVTAQNGAWEARYDPYDLSQIWVRNHHHGGWIRAEWTHLPMVSAPFADFTWRHARQLAAENAQDGEATEAATARVLGDLLRRAGQGPGSTTPDHLSDADRRVATRNQAVNSNRRPLAEPIAAQPVPADDDEDFDAHEITDGDDGATVIPFGVFDARAEARRWP
ncbi:Mu transposase, C-terminal [Saccharopolyspora antimicrobica]|uniref:Mu transposase, C-terminal n=1 Tax=Saccharopolyspora antimicrobica TaxID=455193 RepID=A0A1I4R8X9_9PSEU|nr:Mu transposase C-terminal domain-containing protein [Saccharopolyspora antimicrobica]RKT88112.1 Mu transposase-like protein [Saccharopolyspora antimicrobica]SFM48707.1 Mu transposase, C-terminal [Saccharopolyspora antimicrobica]